MADLKEHGKNISISSVVSMVTLGGLFWMFAQPAMVAQISTAMADDIDRAIEEKTRPIQGAFKVLLLSDINRLKRSIARLEHKRSDEDADYTENDAVRLADYKIELDAYDEAYDDLKDD